MQKSSRALDSFYNFVLEITSETVDHDLVFKAIKNALKPRKPITEATAILRVLKLIKLKPEEVDMLFRTIEENPDRR